MTDILDEARAMLEGVTEGPWERDGVEVFLGERVLVASCEDGDRPAHDAAFIAWCRGPNTGVPALIERVAALEAENKRFRDLLKPFKGHDTSGMPGDSWVTMEVEFNRAEALAHNAMIDAAEQDGSPLPFKKADIERGMHFPSHALMVEGFTVDDFRELSAILAKGGSDAE